MPLLRYCESVLRVTSHGSLRARRPSIAALSSMRLLVVLGSLPYISLTNPSKRRIHAQPPGPGLPTHAPSVVMTTLWAIVWASEALDGMLAAVGFQGAVRFNLLIRDGGAV